MLNFKLIHSDIIVFNASGSDTSLKPFKSKLGSDLSTVNLVGTPFSDSNLALGLL